MQLDADLRSIISVLGLSSDKSWTRMGIAKALQAGLPLNSYARLELLLAEHAKPYMDMIVTHPTLRRRKKKQEPLSSEESQRLQRAARAWSMAMSVYHDKDAALSFLTSEHPMLDNQRPLAVAIATDVGADAVEGVLGRLKYGSAA